MRTAALALVVMLGAGGCSSGQRLEDRVRYLEKIVAPLDPDGLLEDPDLYEDDGEANRFYRLHERTECGR